MTRRTLRVLISGPIGAGKTTLAGAIAKMVRRHRGIVQISDGARIITDGHIDAEPYPEFSKHVVLITVEQS
jgi:adenylate kinase family enzyme